MSTQGQRRGWMYLATAIGLCLGYGLLRGSAWQGSAHLHTLMEAVATVLALIVGVMALVRFYSRKNNTFLFIGSGFVGTALLDGYHTVVTSTLFAQAFPSAPPELVPWSWLASRLFLSVLLWLSWLAWKREERLGAAGRINEATIYAIVLGLTVASFLVFALAPLPPAYKPNWVFPRMQELVPAAFFLLALIGYLRKGDWRGVAFEHWLVLSLILGFLSEAMFMSTSDHLYDTMFDAAHLLKKASYVLVLTGLVISMYELFRQAERGAEEVRQANLALATEAAERQLAVEALRLDEQRLEALLKLNELTEAPLRQITDFALEEGVRLTRSSLGYLAFLSEDEKVLTMHSWSRTAMRECAMSDKPTDYPVETTGLWGEAVRQRRPVVTNDYAASNPFKKGYPQGHVELKRHMNVPIFDGPRIAAVAGVGNKETPYNESDVQELQLLMTGMSRLLQRHRAQEELRSLNESLERRVAQRTAELVRQEAQVRVAKECAETASRAKSQFLAHMSHELRTPLNSVIGFTNILLKNKDGKFGPAELRCLDRVLANGKHLLALINQILDLSRIEARKVDLETAAVALDRLVLDVVGQFEGQLRDRPVQLSAELPERISPLVTDEGKLRQVLINLVGNALKFTEKGRVTVRVSVDEADGRPTQITVSDTGIGIPRDQQEVIFEAYQQADPSTACKYGGTGLGLTISKALCELMGCQLEVQSEVGKGSSFSIILPRPELLAPSAPSPIAPKATLPVNQPAVQLDKPLHSRLVLVINEDDDSRALLAHQLQECGCQVALANSGTMGLRLAKELRPDLITLGLLIPAMEGWTVLENLKASPDLRHIPVVAVSTNKERGAVLGAMEVLRKPVGAEDLSGVLRSFFRPKVLLVEDNEDHRHLVAAHLGGQAVELRAASNGQEALALLAQFTPDVILLDLLLPTMDGMTFLDLIRRETRYQSIPVFVITAKDLTAAERQRLGAQAQAVLKKAEDWGSDLERLLNGLLSGK